MNEYDAMGPEARFELLDQMATIYFGTARWKTAFCRRYSLTPQTLTGWTNNGAPIWAAQAMADALKAQRLDKLTELIKASEI